MGKSILCTALRLAVRNAHSVTDSPAYLASGYEPVPILASLSQAKLLLHSTLGTRRSPYQRRDMSIQDQRPTLEDYLVVV